jgi:hypothetical protein
MNGWVILKAGNNVHLVLATGLGQHLNGPGSHLNDLRHLPNSLGIQVHALLVLYFGLGNGIYAHLVIYFGLGTHVHALFIS